MMGKLQTEEGKMNVSGQVYEEPLTFQCGAHISRRTLKPRDPSSDILESHNDTPYINNNSKKKRSFIDFDACEKKNK